MRLLFIGPSFYSIAPIQTHNPIKKQHTTRKKQQNDEPKPHFGMNGYGCGRGAIKAKPERSTNVYGFSECRCDVWLALGKKICLSLNKDHKIQTEMKLLLILISHVC